jgi:hypothetical protein
VIRGESLRLVTERTFPPGCPRCYQHSAGYARRPPYKTKSSLKLINFFYYLAFRSEFAVMLAALQIEYFFLSRMFIYDSCNWNGIQHFCEIYLHYLFIWGYYFLKISHTYTHFPRLINEKSSAQTSYLSNLHMRRLRLQSL